MKQKIDHQSPQNMTPHDIDDTLEEKEILYSKTAVALLAEATARQTIEDRTHFFNKFKSLLEDYDLLGNEAVNEIITKHGVPI